MAGTNDSALSSIRRLAALGWVFFFVVMPETKGLGLEEIALLFQRPGDGDGARLAAVVLGLGRIVALPPPLIRFIPDSLTYSVPLFLKRQCDRTLGGARGR
jgi:hypothetical protein